MCGIVGVWNRDGRPVDVAAFRSSMEAIRHRGPDDEGYTLINTREGRAVACGGADTPKSLGLPDIENFLDEPFDLALGNRRLAILDISPAGHQPMVDADGTLWMAHNGEIYNFLELRSELEGSGYAFATDTDTEVALAAYRRWGPASLERFVGMWATVIFDMRRRTLFASRDRFGIKPLIYHLSSEAFAFASEAKALLPLTGPPAADDDAVVDYLALGRVDHTERTFFRGLSSLEPGSTITVGAGDVHRDRYWDLAAETEDDRIAELGADEAARGVGGLLSDSIRLQLRSDAPVGTTLSGGLDSSSIVCLVGQMLRERGIERSALGERQKTFTASFDDPALDERRYAEAVVAATGADPHVAHPGPAGLIEALPRLVWHQDQPFQTTSIYAQWCVMELASAQGIKVLLDGQGADETLAGYPVYLDTYLGGLFRAGRWSALNREAAYHQGGRWAGMAAAARVSTPMTMRDAARPWRARHAWPKWLTADVVPDADLPRTPADLRTYLVQSVNQDLQALLRYEDRNSMAFGIEGRVPFLDHRLARYAIALGDDQKISAGWTKVALRRAMRGIVPPEILARRDKIGFRTPQRAWFAQMWPWMRDVLASEPFRSLPYFDRPRIETIMDIADRNGPAGADVDTLWRWVNLGVWFDRFMV